MADYYQKNIKLIQEKSPGLVEYLNNYKDELKTEIITSLSGLPTVTVNINNRKILLHSSYDPYKEATRLVSLRQEQFKKAELVVVLGLGLGYHIEELMKVLPEDCEVWIVEARPEILKTALCAKEMSNILISPRVKLFLGNLGFSTMYHTLDNFLAPGYTNRDIQFFPYPPSLQIDSEFYTSFSRVMRDSIFYLTVVVNTNIFVGPNWPVNTWRNIKKVLFNPQVKNLFDKFKGFSAIVVAAGPSLNEAMEDLKLAQDKAIIIAVGTSFRLLLKNGIIPDIVVVIDASPLNYKHFEGIDEKEAFLVAEPMVYPQILREYRGPIFIAQATAGQQNPAEIFLQKYLGEFGSITGGFSVATLAFDLAKKMGVKSIILVGQDLSFPGNKSHAEGTAFYKEIKEEEKEDYVKVPSNEGKEVLTNTVWVSTIRQFENQIANFEGEVINTSLKGAKISGTKVMTLKEAILNFTQNPLPVKEILGNLWTPLPVSNEKLKEMRDELEKVIEELKLMKEKSKKGIELGKVILGKIFQGSIGGKEIDDKRNALQEIIDSIKSWQRPIFYINPWLQELYIYLHRSEKEKKEGESLLERETKRAGVFCQGINNACEEVIEIMIEALKELDEIIKDKNMG